MVESSKVAGPRELSSIWCFYMQQRAGHCLRIRSQDELLMLLQKTTWKAICLKLVHLRHVVVISQPYTLFLLENPFQEWK